jgi:hypothetical protein
MTYQVVVRGFQYFVVDSHGVTCAGPYIIRHDAQLAADKLSRSEGD